MNDSETRALDSVVRRLESSFAGLSASVNGFQENWKTQDERAAHGRQILYEKIDGFGRDLQGLTHQVRSVMQDVAEMKPAVTDWVNTKNQAMGAKTTASILGNGIYILIGGFFMLVGWALNHFSIIH